MGLTSKPNFEVRTRLNVEMRICAKYLHNSHSFFKSLSKEDKLKYLHYDEMENRREEYFNKKHQEEMEKIKASRTKT